MSCRWWTLEFLHPEGEHWSSPPSLGRKPILNGAGSGFKPLNRHNILSLIFRNFGDHGKPRTRSFLFEFGYTWSYIPELSLMIWIFRMVVNRIFGNPGCFSTQKEGRWPIFFSEMKELQYPSPVQQTTLQTIILNIDPSSSRGTGSSCFSFLHKRDPITNVLLRDI